MSKVERKNLPDVVDAFVDDNGKRDVAIALLERGHEIKKLLGSERDKKTGRPAKGDPGYGLLAELEDVKSELAMIQEQEGLAGLRFGRIGVQTTLVDGRSTLSAEKLLEAGVSPEQIAKGFKVGDSYYKTELFEIKK